MNSLCAESTKLRSALSPADIDIVIPHRNHSHLIGQALHSLQGEPSVRKRVLVIDDNSDPSHFSELRRVVRDFPDAHIHSLNTRVGPVAATNIGLKAVESDFVMTLAADDLLVQGYLPIALSMVRNNEDIAFACGRIIQLDNRTGKIRLKPGWIPHHDPEGIDRTAVPKMFRRVDNFIYTGTCLLRWKHLQSVGPFDPQLGPAADGIVLRKLAFAYGFTFLDQVALVWRVSPDGYSRSSTKQPEVLKKRLAQARESLRTDPNIPRFYPALYFRRQIFYAKVIALRHQTQARAVSRGSKSVKSPWRYTLTQINEWLRILALGIIYRPASIWSLAPIVWNRIADARDAIEGTSRKVGSSN